MTNCINCEFIGDTKLCSNCRYHPYSMISLTDVRNKYSFSEEELDELNIYNVTFEMYGNYCTKYLWKQVDEYACSVYENMEDCYEKKLFLRVHENYLNCRKYFDKKIEKRKKLLQHITVFLEKSEYYNQPLDLQCMHIIEECVKYDDIAPFTRLDNIFIAIKQHLEDNMKRELRKKQLNELLVNINHVDECKLLRSYKNYVYYGGDGNLNVFKKDIQKVKVKENRIAELAELSNDIIDYDFTKIKGWNEYIKNGYLTSYNLVIAELDKIRKQKCIR